MWKTDWKCSNPIKKITIFLLLIERNCSCVAVGWPNAYVSLTKQIQKTYEKTWLLKGILICQPYHGISHQNFLILIIYKKTIWLQSENNYAHTFLWPSSSRWALIKVLIQQPYNRQCLQMCAGRSVMDISMQSEIGKSS